jgi:hypothetical protein
MDRQDPSGFLRRHVHDGDTGQSVGADGTEDRDHAVGAQRHHPSLVLPLRLVGTVPMALGTPPQERHAVGLRSCCELSNLFVGDGRVDDFSLMFS